MSRNDTVIELENIHKVYRMGAEDVHALRGVSLEVRRGEFVAVMGPSGSGKTTLMNLIGLLDKPTSGDFVLEGEDVTLMSERRMAAIRNQKIGFVFQQFNLLSRTSVLDNVLLPTIYGDSRESAKRAQEMLERVGLSGYGHHKGNQLSGGQVQRVAIARALVMEPSLILADEPTGNLDSTTSREILQLFRQVNTDGATVILITHEHQLARWADRTIRVLDGQIVESEGDYEDA